MTPSQELFERARRVIPGGVDSPVRAFGAVGGTPRFVVRGEGAYLVDADGEPLRCPVLTRRGTPCRREPLANGHCPSHQHLIEVREIPLAS